MSRRTTLVGALLGGILLAGLAAPATAAGTPLLVSGDPAVTTLNYGTQVTLAGALDGDLAAATYALAVTSPVTPGKPLFLSYSHTPPAGTSTAAPRLYWRQLNPMSVFPGGPSTGWDALAAGDTAVLPHVGWNTFLTADQPGRYEVTVEDRKGTAGTDDDSAATITLTVLDAYAATASTLTDDWRPAVLAPTYVGVAKALPTSVELGQLTRMDARGTSGGVGILNRAIADLVTLRTNSVEHDALAIDLHWAGVPGSWKSFDRPEQVTPAGRRDIPASYAGVDVLRHIGGVVTTASLDRDGSGSISVPAEDLPRTASTTVVARVPGIVTLGVDQPTRVGAGTVTASGTAPGATTVTVTGGATPVTANVAVDGTWSATVTVKRTSTLIASTGGPDAGASDPVKVTVRSTVSGVRVTSTAKGKIRVWSNGGPGGPGATSVRFRAANGSVVTKAVTPNANGNLTGKTFSGVKSGKRAVQVWHTAPGCSASTRVTVTLVVK